LVANMMMYETSYPVVIQTFLVHDAVV